MRKSVELKCGKARTGTTSSVAVKQNSYVKGKDQNLKQGSSGSCFNVLGAREEEGVESTVGTNNLNNGFLNIAGGLIVRPAKTQVINLSI